MVYRMARTARTPPRASLLQLGMKMASAERPCIGRTGLLMKYAKFFVGFVNGVTPYYTLGFEGIMGYNFA